LYHCHHITKKHKIVRKNTQILDNSLPKTTENEIKVWNPASDLQAQQETIAFMISRKTKIRKTQSVSRDSEKKP